jgi:drug/metabolite transporter (DMT)-like permease
MPHHPVLTRNQLLALVALTIMWGVNWPMMKLSLRELSPLYFRAITMTLGASWLFVFFRLKGIRMWPEGAEWRTVATLALPNMLGWHTISIFGLKELSSGRSYSLAINEYRRLDGIAPKSRFRRTRRSRSMCWRSSEP